MKKMVFLSIIISLFYSCSTNTNDLEVKLINDALICYKTNSKKDTLNIIHFTVTNNSNEVYYFNNIIESRNFIRKGQQSVSIYDSGKSIRMFCDNGKEIRYNTLFPPRPSEIEFLCEAKKINSEKIFLKRLGYNNSLRYETSKGGYTNFFIHPNEIIHFEYCINLTDTVPYNGDYRLGHAIVDSDKKYYAKLYLPSDTTKSKVNLPREVLQTIHDNNVKIYHGVLESNAIPVKVLD